MLLFIDNNIWDYLFENNVDIKRLSEDIGIDLAITLHGKYEVEQISSDKSVKNYAKKAIESSDVLVRGYASLSRKNLPCEYKEYPRHQGMFSGFMVDKNDGVNEFKKSLIERYSIEGQKKRNNILRKNEADIDLACLSINHFVITFDKKMGPLRIACNKGYNVIMLECKPQSFNEFKAKISEFIKG